MKKRYFLFDKGMISEVEQVIEGNGDRLYFRKAPRNFLELSDELKKLSFLCDGVYVAFSDSNMEIFLFKRDSLELFTKLVLSKEHCLLENNERLKDFLFSIED
jgi:hypothetical protein